MTSSSRCRPFTGSLPCPAVAACVIALAGASGMRAQDTASGAVRAPQGADVSGRYTLRRFNGNDLPSGYNDAKGASRLITGGALSIARDRTWQMRINWRSELSEGRTSGDQGSFTQSGIVLTFTSSEQGDFSGTLGGRATLTLNYYFDSDAIPERFAFVKDGVREDRTPVTAPADTGRSAARPPADQSAPARASQGANSPAPTPAATKWRVISAGAFHACGLATTGAVYCWGLRAHPPGSPGGNSPSALAGGVTFTTVSVGSPISCDPDRPAATCPNATAYHACGLTATGDAYCWGSNEHGELGDGSTSESAEPVKVSGELQFSQIAAGEAVTCGVTTVHVLHCWGTNEHGELGIGAVDSEPHVTPRAVASGVIAVTASWGYVCALHDAGSAYCWGSGAMDRLGNPDAIGYGPNPSPLAVAGDIRFTSIASGRTHVCATTAHGTAYCWGNNQNYESGPGTAPAHLTRVPSPIPGAALSAVATGTAYDTCGLTSRGEAYCWGLNDTGQLGIGDASPQSCGYGSDGCSSSPAKVAGGLAFSSLSAGVGFACGVTTDGDVYCWGDNTRGQLGTGDKASSSVPVRVTNP